MSTVCPCSFFVRAHAPRRKKGAAFAVPRLMLFITPEQNS